MPVGLFLEETEGEDLRVWGLGVSESFLARHPFFSRSPKGLQWKTRAPGLVRHLWCTVSGV